MNRRGGDFMKIFQFYYILNLLTFGNTSEKIVANSLLKICNTQLTSEILKKNGSK